MHVVISERRVLTALHKVSLIDDLFAVGHHFHMADMFLNQEALEATLQRKLIDCGMVVDQLSSSEMKHLVDIKRANPNLCVGNSASLTLSLTRSYPILVGNHGLATTPQAAAIGLLDICWVMDQLEGVIELERLRSCFEAISTAEPRNLHSPGVAMRLQRYSQVSQVSAL